MNHHWVTTYLKTKKISDSDLNSILDFIRNNKDIDWQEYSNLRDREKEALLSQQIDECILKYIDSGYSANRIKRSLFDFKI